MFRNNFRVLLGVIAAGFILMAGVVMAQDSESGESRQPAAERSAKPELPELPELPEKVAELVNALSGVQNVEKLDNGLFAVHRRMNVTGSRIPRNVKMEVTENGEVVDWGRTPMFTRTYTHRELIETGEIDLAEALQRLDPAIQGHGGR